MGAGLRIELFLADLDAFVAFYTRVLGFQLVEDRRGAAQPYAAVALDGARVGAVRPWTPVDERARNVPTGVEVVLEVDDVRAAHARVVESGWPIAEPLQEREWGLTDFRVRDPGGYYVRVTSR